MNRWSSIAVILFFVLIAGCTGQYTQHFGQTEDLSTGKSVAVSVFMKDSAQGEWHELEAYLTASLLARGHDVRTIRPEEITGAVLEKRLLTDDPYSGGRSLSKGLETGGEIETTPDSLGELLNQNEVRDANTRVGEYIALSGKLQSEWGVDYLLIVHQFDTYGFASYLIRVVNRKIVNGFVISANRDGYREALGGPRKGRTLNAEDGEVDRLELLRLAEFIVANL